MTKKEEYNKLIGVIQTKVDKGDFQKELIEFGGNNEPCCGSIDRNEK